MTMKTKWILICFLTFYWSVIHGTEKPEPNITVNLMWINKETPQDQKFVFPMIIERSGAFGGSEDEKRIDAFERVKSWATYYPVTIYYNAQFISDGAVENTEKKIDECKFNNPVKLMDIRHLKVVIEHPDVFNDKTDKYFYFDLLRAIAAMEILYGDKPDIDREVSTHQNEAMLQEPTDYFVYADWSVPSMDKNSLMDDNTVSNLKEYGMVMAKRDGGYENFFQITANNNQNLHIALYYAVINLNIQRARKINKFSQSDFEWDQIVYFSYRGMFAFYEHLTGILTMTLNDQSVTSEWGGVEEKLLNCFGLENAYPTGTRMSVAWDDSKMDHISKVKDYSKRFVSSGLGALIPIKQGNFPISHFG